MNKVLILYLTLYGPKSNNIEINLETAEVKLPTPIMV